MCREDLPSFIYLVNHLFILVWTWGYLFYFLDYNPVLLLLFYGSDCSSFVLWGLFEVGTYILLFYFKIW